MCSVMTHLYRDVILLWVLLMYGGWSLKGMCAVIMTHKKDPYRDVILWCIVGPYSGQSLKGMYAVIISDDT